LPIKSVDVENYGNKKAMEYLKHSFDLKDKEIYDNLTKVIELCENKTVKPDAIRMYINKQLSSILARMNGKVNRANYNKDTLGILFEIFSRKEDDSRRMDVMLMIVFLIAINLI